MESSCYWKSPCFSRLNVFSTLAKCASVSASIISASTYHVIVFPAGLFPRGVSQLYDSGLVVDAVLAPVSIRCAEINQIAGMGLRTCIRQITFKECLRSWSYFRLGLFYVV